MSGLRFGPGAATGYPFARKQDAETAKALLDLQVTISRRVEGGLYLSAIDPVSRSIEVASADSVLLLSLSEPDVKIIGATHYWQWYTEEASIRVTVDPSQPGYSGAPLELCARVLDYAANDVQELIFETLDGDVSSRTKPLKMRGGFNTQLSTDGSAMNVAVSPGNGQGTVQNCSDDSLAVRSIAGGLAGSNGNLIFSGDDCFRIQPEIRGTGDSRTVVPGSYYLHDDCEACCRCEEKAAVWRLAKEMQDKLIPMVGRYQELRRVYNEKVNQIHSGNNCLTRPLLNHDLVNFNLDSAMLYVSVCNGSTETITDVVISVSPLFIHSGTLFRYAGLDPDFFEVNPGVIKIPDNRDEFYSLPEQLLKARHFNLEPANKCNTGYAYSYGGKNHLKFPGDVHINQRIFDPRGYEIKTTTDATDEDALPSTKISADGGIEFNLHCVEPGDTRYFSLLVEFEGVPVDIVDGQIVEYGVDAQELRDARNVALIVHSPTHPELNYSIKMGTGGVLPCNPDSVTETEE